jgi:GNAT superfamily N-acetyltransferase
VSEAPIHAAAGNEVALIRVLFSEYAASLPVGLDFQDFDAELADPLAVYECVLIAAEGCVALRRIDRVTCEMKRLYVRPTARGSGLGRRLVVELIERARAAGYERMLLDTLPTMSAARDLYQSLGFRPTRPYRYNPVPGTSFLELELTAPDDATARP